MKNKIIALSLGLAGSAFALDEYMPVAPNALEVGVAVSPVFMTGSYDGDGEKVDAGGDPVGTGVGVQLKYGVMAGLDVEFAWVYATYNEDAGDASGLLQPELGVKYAIGTSGIAVYGSLILPFATGDFDTDPSFLNLGIQPGVVYGRDYGKIVGVAQISYTINLENGDDYKMGNELHVFLKPGYKVSDKLMGYLGVDYDMFSETEMAGNGFGDDGYLLTLLPGATFVASPALKLEANVPFTVAGKNTDSMWGIGLTARYTIGL